MRAYPLTAAPSLGALLTPNERIVAFVDSNGTDLVGYTDFVNDNLVKTLAEALPRVNAEGDTVVCMMGHAENVVDGTMLANLVAGTRIIGMGSPDQSNAPTFTWNAVGSIWTAAVADVVIRGLRLEMNGADDITQGLNITGDGFSLLDSYVQCGTGAANDVLAAVGGTGDDTLVQGNEFISTGGTSTDIFVSGGSDGLRVVGNRFDTSSDVAGNGQLNLTVLSTNVYLGYNVLNNRVAAGLTCMDFNDVASTGLCEHNIMSVLNAGGVASAQGITALTGVLVRFNENYCSDEPGRSGILSPPVVAT